ncbi:MAG: ATP-binding protein [Arthrospira sp. SH-MAG29]|nr:ATP-binding protein [Arthrospira sp. SH-MAG29]MBS0016056.1 ATP-binding protein [Arthrospira sp. SH-MAG29]
MSSPLSEAIAKIRFRQHQALSLLLYQEVMADPIGQAFLSLLDYMLQGESHQILQAYSYWFRVQAEQSQSWQNYLITQVLRADNPFSRQAQQSDLTALNPSLIAATRHDLEILHTLYKCQGTKIAQWVQAIAQLPELPMVWEDEPIVVDKIEELPLGNQLAQSENWGDAIEAIAAHYRKYGTGKFAQSQAFRWRSGQLMAIANPDPIHLNQLVGYEPQRQILLKNTEFLLAGYSALNVLLYGSRGSGKSSLVKALLHQYSDRGLRLIEVTKSELRDLPQVIEQLRGVPQKFIIFVDDLSFEEDDDAFKALKVVLEGNLTARPENVVVYATSNRRHLVREFFDERPRPQDHNEVQAWDTVQEKLSFADRFGLTLTFEPADQETYLTIVRHLASQAGITIDPEDLDYRARQWATRHNGRSGRTARQFIDFLAAEIALADQ